MKRKYYKKRIRLFLFVTLILGIFILNSCESKKNEIVVAIASSLTGSLAENGKDMANGATLAIDEINERGGIKGKKIKYILFDDQSEPKMAANVANRIIQDKKIIAVIGHLSSGCMLAAAPIYNKVEIPVIMPVPTNPEITQKGYNNLFRIPPTDDEQAPFLAKFLIKKDPDGKVAIVHDMTDYGYGFAESFRKTYESFGKHVIAFEGVRKEARDYRTLIYKLKQLMPDYVVLGATYDLGGPFVKQMKELGLNATVLAGDGCFGSAYLKMAGEAAEGTIVSFIAPDRNFSEKLTLFFDKYEKKYGKVVSFAPLGYDAGLIVIEALKKVKGEPSREKLIKILHSPDFELNGITGKIKFKKNGDNFYSNLVLYKVQNGKFISFKSGQ